MHSSIASLKPPYSSLVNALHRTVTAGGMLLLLCSCGATSPMEWSQGLEPETSSESRAAESISVQPLVDFDFSGPSPADGQPATTMSPWVAGRILAAVAQTQETPLENLQITASRDRQWRDSCLGIFAVEQLCAQVITPGWQAIVSDGEQDWVYHSDEAGELVSWNKRASQTGGQISLGTLARLGQLEGSVLSVVAWSRSVAAEAGDAKTAESSLGSTKTSESKALLINGNLMELDPEGQPQGNVGKLGTGQIQAFDQQRNDAELGQFDGLRYSTAVKTDSLEPVVWITLLDSQGIVQYDAAMVTQLPPELQALHLAWEAIANNESSPRGTSANENKR